ncbi:MAG TPA: hypothetical protein PK971_17375 [Saprospiraceae bacterium]|nr:hypothetical protein [Saprospiraceae bacterium]
MTRTLPLFLLFLLGFAPAAQALTHLPQPSAQRSLGFFQKMALRMAARRIQRIMPPPMAGDSSSPCGQIWLLRGDKVPARDLSVDSAFVRYRPCDQPTYPLFVVDKHQVVQVTDAAGKTLYKRDKGKNTPQSHQIGKESWSSLLALSLSLFSLGAALWFGIGILVGIMGVASLIFGAIAFNRHRQRGSRRERSFALVGLLVGGLLTIATVFWGLAKGI